MYKRSVKITKDQELQALGDKKKKEKYSKIREKCTKYLNTSLLSSRSDSLLNSSVFRFSKSDSPTAMGTVTVRLGLFMNDM